MFEIGTALCTNLFRTYVIKRFMTIFFEKKEERKSIEIGVYCVFFLLTSWVHVTFLSLMGNMVLNLLLLYVITQFYKGGQKKKVFISLFLYSLQMLCDVLSVFSLSNYVIGEGYPIIAPFVTVFLICICELFIERFVIIRKKGHTFTPPYCGILLFIPALSILLLLMMFMEGFHHRLFFIGESAGILFMNLLMLHLYNVLLDYYVKMEEKTVFEKQAASYANQLQVLMKSEKEIRALEHDMKHHLHELLAMANRNENKEIEKYIHNMKMFMENPEEYIYSGNKDVDSILNYMLHKAKEELKEVEFKVNVPKEMNVEGFDLNVILGNLLDNAILAASNTEEKYLSLTVSYDRGMLFLHIMNSYAHKLLKKGGVYLTSKKERKGHGIGLQNVKKILDSYDGSMEITEEKNRFDVKIIMYVPLSKEELA